MDIFFTVYNELLWRPLFNALIFLYTTLPFQDMGVAIILLTVAVRALFAPLMYQSQRTQKKLVSLQGELKKIQETHKNDKEKQMRSTMELYAAHKVNPFTGCLLLLFQLPVLIALFHVFQKGFDPSLFIYLYSFVPHPETIHAISFGIINLSEGSIWLGAIAAITQFLQARLATQAPLSLPKDGADFGQMMQWQSVYVFPFIIFITSFSFPSALILYWTALNIFGIFQEIITKRYFVS